MRTRKYSPCGSQPQLIHEYEVEPVRHFIYELRLPHAQPSCVTPLMPSSHCDSSPLFDRLLAFYEAIVYSDGVASEAFSHLLRMSLNYVRCPAYIVHIRLWKLLHTSATYIGLFSLSCSSRRYYTLMPNNADVSVTKSRIRPSLPF